MRQTFVLLYSPDEALRLETAQRLGESVVLRRVQSVDALHAQLGEQPPSQLVLDCRITADGGHASDRLIEELQLRYPQLQMILLTAEDCPEPLARRAVCSPIDHLPGYVDGERLAAAIASHIPENTTPQIVAGPGRERLNESFGEMVLEGVTRRFETNSPQLKRILDDLAVASAHDVTILLIGETGSGKTYLSSLIHEASPRRNEPFLHVACGALPRELIESEMFGHVKGSFTSAHADKEGKFVAAGRGTILLDEIDVLGPEQQVKLLRVIENGEFEPVGSNRTMKSQARLVVASNMDLQPLVEQGRFRPDLYYRLNMLKFDLPPLRKRKVDVVPLAKKFVQKYTLKHNVSVHRVDDSLLDALLEYPWPGNVRELEHVIQRAVIYCRDGVLSREHLPANITAGHAGPTNDPSVMLTGRDSRPFDASLGRQVALTEKEIIEQALYKNNFSRTNTAKDLGISRVTLYNKMKKYGMLRGA